MKLADLSIEVGHLYLRDLRQAGQGDAEEFMRRRISTAVDWVRPVVEREEGRGRTVSTCILVDNYFWNPKSSGPRPSELAKGMADQFADAGLPIDHVVFEASLAPSVHHMVNRLVPKPDIGAGSDQDPLLKAEEYPTWLSNGEPARDEAPRGETRGISAWDEGESDDSTKSPQVFGQGRPHSIHLDVELRDDSDHPWACPTLAAWWQLVRLGALEVFENAATPPGTHSRQGAPSFAARRTLTVLAPEFLEVEHAVRSILGQVALNDEFRRRLSKRPGSVPGHLQRMASIVAWDLSYIFVDDEFDDA